MTLIFSVEPITYALSCNFTLSPPLTLKSVCFCCIVA
nr:MAG TPA: hypothetical protein [Bacteriophage sp.]